MTAHTLQEVDELLVTVIVDNEVDPMSIYRTPGIEASNRFLEVGLVNGTPIADRGLPNIKEMALSSLCCGAHGLSLLITAVKGEQRRSVLFDSGPEEQIWKLNAGRLKPDLSGVDVVVLSHWHRDHSGGMLEAVRQIKSAKAAAIAAEGRSLTEERLLIDLHSNRPDFRGIDFPGAPLSLEADPTFEEIEAAGGIVAKNDEVHTILDDMFLVSGFIPRVTPFEVGLKFGMRFDKAKGAWESDELVADERFVMCNVRNKGLVIFSGCSHAGVVNVLKHATALSPSTPLHAIIGGYHLADDMDPNLTKTKATVQAIKQLNPQVLVPGHCSGWRVKQMIENEMPGRLAPSTVGTKFRIGAEEKENLKGRPPPAAVAVQTQT